jgi:hypothetical protein
MNDLALELIETGDRITVAALAAMPAPAAASWRARPTWSGCATA